MPRGRKKTVNISERIEIVKAELKKLEAEQAEEDKAKLIEAFEGSGKTLGEVIAWLKGE